MKTIMLVAIVTMALIATGCSNKELIAQRDQTIEDLQSELDRYKQDLETQRKMNEELDATVEELKKDKRILMEQREHLTHITLDGAATFASARATLTMEAKSVINELWGVLGKYPDRWILIEGHTDDQAINDDFKWKYASNWELSTARANSVLHYLVEEHGADPSRLMAVGRGEYQPVADNATPEGRANNRRVVITVGSKADVAMRAALGGR